MTVRTTAIHSRLSHSQRPSTAVGGKRAKPTASCWKTVFSLATGVAGMLTPFAPANVR